MKKIWVLGMLLLLVLAACAPAQTEKKEVVSEPTKETAPTTQTTPQPTQEAVRTAPTRPLPSERQDTTTTPPPTEVVVESKTTMNPALRDLLKRADEKLSSVQFLYGGTETQNLFLNTYFVKGDKMKIHLYEENYYVRDGYYDNVYVNDAVACCEEASRCKSHNIDNTGKKFDIDVASLKIPKTPYQWVKEVPATAQVVGPQTVNSRSVTYIKYTDKNNQNVEMWIDDTYGVAHKVIVTDANGNPITYQFNDLKFNGLKDTDFNAPCD